jgi:photosystem II stability/assembly factor-like uncharacterized protein
MTDDERKSVATNWETVREIVVASRRLACGREFKQLTYSPIFRKIIPIDQYRRIVCFILERKVVFMRFTIYYCISFSLLLFLSNSPTYAQWKEVFGTPTYCFASNGTSVALNSTGGVYFSLNGQSDWNSIDEGISTREIWSLAFQGSHLFAGTDSGIFLSTNNIGDWRRVDGGLALNKVVDITFIDSIFFAAVYDQGILVSTDYGEHWRESDSGLTDKKLRCLYVDGPVIYAGTLTSGVFHSTDYGTNWQQLGLYSYDVRAIVIAEGNIYAGTNKSVFRSTDDGSTWKPLQIGLPDTATYEGIIMDLCGSGPHIFAACPWALIFYTSAGNNGWGEIASGLPSAVVISQLEIIGSYLYVSSEWGLGRRPLSEMTAVGGGNMDAIPTQFSLAQNYPNPFNPSTMISYALPFASYVKLTVYDILGREITVLINEQQPPGDKSVRIDMNNYPSGVYFYKLTVGMFMDVRKMVLTR